ncbi:heme ABC exporter ATP-binding protein CcmA [Candidatus Aerophobetes bacterium]|uniref:Heme ABC exporter ATP-binding protein CcmA n=1 Tax=Aerophobetes bacterium TaxID=2030807 RepID=A0A523VYE8_UNCAE|nr:MAG: heme ABC exporter ATP-binding protein CcmA [Candidatus Aerophobetes bacterium]
MQDKERSVEPECMVEVKGIGRSFGNIVALEGIDLRVKKGEFLTIIGPNGAGKTTLIKILSTLMKPSSGEGRIAGFDLREEQESLRKNIGMLSHHTFLYENLTAHENLKFYGGLYEVENIEKEIKRVIGEVGLETRLYDTVRTFSRGMKQRLSIARSIIHDPSLLLLDEPYTGLDQWSERRFKNILRRFHEEGKTIIMTTHNLSSSLELGDRVIILSSGKILHEQEVREIDLEELERLYPESRQRVRI